MNPRWPISPYGNDIDGTHYSYGVGMLVCQDPPHHTALRDAVRRSFGAKEILAMEDHIRTVSRELISSFKAAGAGDFTDVIALMICVSRSCSTRLVLDL